MSEIDTPERNYSFRDGTAFIMDWYESVIGRKVCEEAAREIVETRPDKESLIKYITEMLVGIEYIKNGQRNKRQC